MSIELLERAASDLADLADEVVFVGGATLAVWITDPGAPPIRPTKDVDVIVEVTTRAGYYAFEERLRTRGFQPEGKVICRWIHRDTRLIVDAMPADPAILGFSNRWQREALPWAAEVQLPADEPIRVTAGVDGTGPLRLVEVLRGDLDAQRWQVVHRRWFGGASAPSTSASCSTGRSAGGSRARSAASRSPSS